MATTQKKKDGQPLRRRPSGAIQNNSMEHSSKDSPCPVCDRTKDRDCSWSSDGDRVLCHTYATKQAPQTAKGYHFTGRYCDDGIHGADSAAIYTKKKPHNHTGTGKPTQRLKSSKQVIGDVQRASAHVESEVDHLALMVAEGHETPESAQVSLAAWCKEYGHDKYAASQLLKAKVKSIASSGEQSASDEDPRWLREYRLLESKFGGRLRFNELTKEVELGR